MPRHLGHWDKSMDAPTTRLVRDYALVGAAALLLAVLLASAGHWAQHTLASTPYLLLPVNLTSFYFLPLFAGGVLWCGRVRGRGANRWMLVAFVLSLALTAARVLYWGSIAWDLERNPFTRTFEQAASEESSAYWIVSAVGAISYVTLFVALARSLVTPRHPASMEPDEGT